MQESKYNLIALLQLIKSRAKLVFGITLLAMIAAIIFVALRPNSYTSVAKVIVKSYMNFDRQQMYNENTLYTKEVFAKDFELDKAMTILESDDIKGYINASLQYDKIKNLKQNQALRKIEKKYEAKRTDNYDIEVKFTDTDSNIAQKGVVAALEKAEALYINYFEDYNRDISKEIDFKIAAVKDSVAILNDSIVALRSRYNLYDQLLPTRGDNVIETQKTVSPAAALGIEQLKSLTAVKDKLDEERSKYTTLKNEYNSYLNSDKMHVFYKVNGPYVPTEPSNIHPVLVILGSMICAFIFACLLVLINYSWRKL